jgi:hypothetical protein
MFYYPCFVILVVVIVAVVGDLWMIWHSDYPSFDQNSSHVADLADTAIPRTDPSRRIEAAKDRRVEIIARESCGVNGTRGSA